jgi:hypothetical protein
MTVGLRMDLFGGVGAPFGRVSLKAGRGTVSLVDARGLAGRELLADLRPNLFLAEVLEPALGVDLMLGEETPVPVRVRELRPNANVSRISAMLKVREASAPAPPATTSVEVTTGSGAAASTQSFGVSVVPPRLPRNVQIRLDRGEVFWTHGGTLEAGEHELEGFAEHVNRYLDEVKAEGGEPVLRFLVASEAPGNVSIDVTSVEYTLLQTETWPNPLDGSLRIDRNLQLEFAARSRIELAPLHDPLARRMGLVRVMVDLSGEVGPERLLVDVPAVERGQAATVSGDYAVGQGIRLDSGPGAPLGFEPGATIRVAGVVAALRADAECELYVELQADVGGRPAGGVPLASRTLTLAPAQDGAAAGWAFAAFDAAAEVAVDTDYWVVFRGIRGTARLALAGGAGAYLTDVRVNRGGQMWRPLRVAGSDLVAAMGFVYLPEPDNASAAVELGLEGGTLLRADPAPTVQRVTFDAGTAAEPAALVIGSHARGSLRLANVVQEFGAQEGVER